MQELLTEIEILKKHINRLLEKYKHLKQENVFLKRHIKTLEEDLEKSKKIIKTTEGTEKDFIAGELSKYIKEIDDLIKILS